MQKGGPGGRPPAAAPAARAPPAAAPSAPGRKRIQTAKDAALTHPSFAPAHRPAPARRAPRAAAVALNPAPGAARQGMIALALALAAAWAFGVQSARAAEDFGTKAEARALASTLVAIIDRDGVAAAARAVLDPDGPFRHSRMGVNLFHGSTVIADNREPETVATDYADTADLTGALVWPIISAAAEAEDDALLKWYHYDTQEVYDYHCFSMKAARDDGAVMICR